VAFGIPAHGLARRGTRRARMARLRSIERSAPSERHPMPAREPPRAGRASHRRSGPEIDPWSGCSSSRPGARPASSPRTAPARDEGHGGRARGRALLATTILPGRLRHAPAAGTRGSSGRFFSTSRRSSAPLVGVDRPPPVSEVAAPDLCRAHPVGPLVMRRDMTRPAGPRGGGRPVSSIRWVQRPRSDAVRAPRPRARRPPRPSPPAWSAGRRAWGGWPGRRRRWGRACG